MHVDFVNDFHKSGFQEFRFMYLDFLGHRAFAYGIFSCICCSAGCNPDPFVLHKQPISLNYEPFRNVYCCPCFLRNSPRNALCTTHSLFRLCSSIL